MRHGSIRLAQIDGHAVKASWSYFRIEEMVFDSRNFANYPFQHVASRPYNRFFGSRYSFRVRSVRLKIFVISSTITYLHLLDEDLTLPDDHSV
jgi:hypothetical protein